jgi:hypothetical protein
MLFRRKTFEDGHSQSSFINFLCKTSGKYLAFEPRTGTGEAHYAEKCENRKIRHKNEIEKVNLKNALAE